jgi:hypothetical protein
VDNWHPFGALFDKFGFRVIYDSNSRLDAKLDIVLKQGNWCWRPARTEDLVTIQSRLMDVPIGGIDKPVWSLAKSGVFTCAKTWNHLRKKKEAVRWWPLVWHSFAIPKQAFILWLALLNKLLRTGCLLGVLKGILIVVSARLVLRAETTFSFLVVLALEFGKLVYSDVAC